MPGEGEARAEQAGSGSAPFVCSGAESGLLSREGEGRPEEVGREEEGEAGRGQGEQEEVGEPGAGETGAGKRLEPVLGVVGGRAEDGLAA